MNQNSVSEERITDKPQQMVMAILIRQELRQSGPLKKAVSVVKLFPLIIFNNVYNVSEIFQIKNVPYKFVVDVFTNVFHLITSSVILLHALQESTRSQYSSPNGCSPMCFNKSLT